MAESILARNLHVSLGGKKQKTPILSGVDFSAQPGEVVGICGPNGVGKSTLLRTLAGFLQPDAGEVQLLGRPLASIPVKERATCFAYMHQDLSLAFDFSVAEIVRMGRYPYQSAFSAPGPEDGEIVDEALQQAGILPLKEARYARLSGGERQRVMLARALAQRTPLLLLDEPTASLDMAFAQRLYALARKRTQAGGTVVIVMHDLRAAARVCDKLALLHQGRVLAQGPPAEVLTGERLHAAYGVQAVPFPNPVGEWDYYLSEGDSAK